MRALPFRRFITGLYSSWSPASDFSHFWSAHRFIVAQSLGFEQPSAWASDTGMPVANTRNINPKLIKTPL